MRVLVLGGTGFIGSALTKGLVEANYDVSVISRSLPQDGGFSGANYYSSTLDNVELHRKLLRDIDIVFHVASDTTPGTSMGQPTIESLNNIMPTLRFLEQMQSMSSAHLIYISSGGAIYSNENSSSFDEQSPTKPLSYYGAGKVAIEVFLDSYSQQTGNNVTVLRASNVYGPGQRLKSNFGIIPTLFNKAISGETFEIWGDGSNIRDYLYIDSLVELCKKVMDSSTSQFEVFNAGSGKGFSILNLLNRIESITSKNIHTEMHPSRGVDVKSVVLDVSKAKKLLNWVPDTKLSEGLEKTWRWFNK